MEISTHKSINDIQDLIQALGSHKGKIRWNYYGIYLKNLTERFIDDHINDINWILMSEYFAFTKEQLIKYQNKIGWSALGKNLKVDIECVEPFIGTVCLDNFFSNRVSAVSNAVYYNGAQIPEIPEKYIDLFADNISIKTWAQLSAMVALSEECIEKYSDKVNWTSIFMYQVCNPKLGNLSLDFLVKHADKMGQFNYLNSRVSGWRYFYNQQYIPKELISCLCELFETNNPYEYIPMERYLSVRKNVPSKYIKIFDIVAKNNMNKSYFYLAQAQLTK